MSPFAAWFGSPCGEEDRIGTTQLRGTVRAARGLPVSGMCPGCVLHLLGPLHTILSLEQQH